MNYRDKWINSKNNFIKAVQENFGHNLDLIIMQAYEDDKVIDNWSDLDFFIIFKKVNFETQKRISEIKESLESEDNIHIGSTILSSEEFDYKISTLCPLKINLMKLGLCYPGTIIKRHEIIYGEREHFKFDISTTDNQTFLREIAFFRSYIRNLIRDKAVNNVDDLIRPVIKTSKYIVLCSLLHKSLDTINNFESLYEASLAIFDDFEGDFQQIIETEGKKYEINQKHSDDFFASALNFLENFVDYYFNKCINKQE